MSHIKCLSVPAKGFEADVAEELKVVDVVSIPVDEKYEHYTVSGFIGNNYLLTPAKFDE